MAWPAWVGPTRRAPAPGHRGGAAPSRGGRSVLDVPASHEAMVRACRNLGRPGVVSSAISAVDIALWDCKARLVGRGAGGPHRALPPRASPCTGAAASPPTTTPPPGPSSSVGPGSGHTRVKIKIGESWGRCVERDLERVAFARRVIGDQVELFTDANGAYTPSRPCASDAVWSTPHRVTWFEEPVSSDDLEGLREVKDQLSLDVAAGEYGYDEVYFARMLGARAVDCLQIDVTRCGGFTSWLRSAGLAAAAGSRSQRTVRPNLHAHVGTAVPHLRHVEYFHDHQRVDALLFDGLLVPSGGMLTPRRGEPGHGMVLKESDAERFRT